MNHNINISLDNTITDICRAREGKNCKDCVYQGTKCDSFKHRHHVLKPLERYSTNSRGEKVQSAIKEAKKSISQEVKKNAYNKEERGEER